MKVFNYLVLSSTACAGKKFGRHPEGREVAIAFHGDWWHLTGNVGAFNPKPPVRCVKVKVAVALISPL